MNSIFIASFIKRYWQLHIVFILLVLVGKVDQIVYFVGPLFYLLQLCVGVAEAVLLVKHMIFKYTIDAFTQDGVNGESPFQLAWSKISDDIKVKYVIYCVLAFTLAFSWIAASIAK